MAGTLPVLANEGGLSRYLDEIRKFPMLEPSEEFTSPRPGVMPVTAKRRIAW